VEQSSLARNPLSIAGAALATISALAFIVFYVSHALGWWISPSAGLVGFVAIPAFFLPQSAWALRRSTGMLPLPRRRT